MGPSQKYRAFLQLPPNATSDSLKEHFSQYGEVTDVYTPADKSTGKPKGIAFITFDVSLSTSQTLAWLLGLDLNCGPFL